MASDLGKKLSGALWSFRTQRRIEAKIAQYDLNNMPLPTEVEIETLNRCNGVCPFCPVNANEPQRPYAKMTEELFRKVIDDLGALHYRGYASLYSNNEPFLDERLIEWQKYAKETVPDAFWRLYTNGSMLTVEKLQGILPYLDQLVIDNYNDAGQVNDNLTGVAEYIKNNEEAGRKVKLWMRKQHEVLTSRGGQAPNKKDVAKAARAKCVLPFQQLIVRPDGKVSLCNSDALGVYTLGDLNNQTILEVWNGEKSNEIRAHMKETGRQGLTLCGRCDQIGGTY